MSILSLAASFGIIVSNTATSQQTTFYRVNPNRAGRVLALMPVFVTSGTIRLPVV